MSCIELKFTGPFCAYLIHQYLVQISMQIWNLFRIIDQLIRSLTKTKSNPMVVKKRHAFQLIWHSNLFDKKFDFITNVRKKCLVIEMAWFQKVFYFGSLSKKGAKSLPWVLSTYLVKRSAHWFGTFFGDEAKLKKSSEIKPTLVNIKKIEIKE